VHWHQIIALTSSTRVPSPILEYLYKTKKIVNFSGKKGLIFLV
jgi:hypothetical protein